MSQIEQIAESTQGDVTAMAFHLHTNSGPALLTTKIQNKRDLSETVRKETTTAPYAEWGSNNLRPQDLTVLAEANDLIPRVIEFQKDIIYGQGLIYGFEFVEKGVDRFERVYISEIEAYFKEICLSRYIEEAIDDKILYNNFFAEIRGNAGGEIIDLGCLDATECRLALQDKNDGLIKKCYLSANWDTDSNAANADIIDTVNPYYKVAQQIRESKSLKHIIPMRTQRRGRKYYDKAQWEGLIDSGWLQLAQQIPTFKKSWMTNQISPKWHIQVPENYWPWRYPEWAKLDAAERQKRVNEVLQEFVSFMKGAEKAGQALITTYRYNEHLGKEFPGWRIDALRADAKGGEYIEDSQEADFHINRAFGVDSTLVQSQSKGQSSGGGSDKRVAANLHILMSKRTQNKILEPVDVLADLNNWSKRFEDKLQKNPITFMFKSYFMATLDQVNNDKRM